MPNLTKSYVDSLEIQAAPYIKWDSKVPGFGVKIYANGDNGGGGTKSFVLRYSNTAGKRRMETLGKYGPLTPAQARERAEQRVVEIRDGADPLAEKKAKRRAVLSGGATFQEVVDKFIEHNAKPRQRTWAQTKRTLEVDCADWLDRPITSITKIEAQDLIDGFLAEGHQAKARVTFGWLRTLFRWAWRQDIITENIMDRLEIHIEPKSRDRVYSDDEIRAVWQAANSMGGVEGGYVKLLLLLSVRKSELSGMKRSEFDDPENPTLWVIPHERVKIRKSARAKRSYIVPPSTRSSMPSELSVRSAVMFTGPCASGGRPNTARTRSANGPCINA